MKNGLKIFAVVSFLMCANAFADTRPNPPGDRGIKEIKDLMKLGQYARCSLTQSFILQTKEGLGTPDQEQYPKVILFENLAPEASSPSDFATYALSWENKDFSFYFFMNSQIGEIRIEDKNKNYSSETDLDLSDFGKQEPYIGKARLVQKEDIMVTDPRDEKKQVPGERYTYLTGSCQFLNHYYP